ncbi:NAD-dependent epimerase/dehydratase family protein [Allokutzneria sp. A3M-2-11 16]|uniref:NAD-dependent epimerase/dehydratase family protein n=1 Tax=Allokutzneria sp. A3M-2-11 16 TaxID=2962043 RepID=UPI0020B74A87|nr:NAD-dependent epimerase/dehydratase family protein [Allokutzneria sp. A3M-2-11 16]MCP3797883.1 NAD-dependent epimerase/dehydratase family protein [Allokutzneria sp. A3M-2-11 16]
MDVFVTGGSGFVGAALIRRLVGDGHAVRALARSERAASAVADLGAKPVRGDLSDVGSLREAARGAELAFHAAARTPGSGSRVEFLRDNAVGTLGMLTACRDAGVRRLVHVGSEAGLRNGQPLVNANETFALQPNSSAAYAASKARAEAEVLGFDGLDTVVLRPCVIWGRGDTTLLPSLVSAVRAGKFAWIGGGRHFVDVTHVDNVVEGLVLAADRGRAGEAYFVTDGRPVVFREFATELLATQGISEPKRSIPAGLARIAAASGEAVWELLGLRGAPPVDRMSVWVSGAEGTIDISKARSELGYAPVRSLESGLAELAGRE